MELLIFNLLFWIIFYVVFGLAHGYIAKQLEYMQYKYDKDYNKLSYNELKAKYYKGKWHTAFGLSRVVLHLGLPFSFYLLGTDLKESIALLLLGATIGILLFDSMVNLARGLGISWKFIGTCEGRWDGDCIWLWLEKKGISHFVIKFLLVIGSIFFYIF